MPLGPYKNFKDCVAHNKHKGDPKAYCGALYQKIHGMKLEPIVVAKGYLSLSGPMDDDCDKDWNIHVQQSDRISRRDSIIEYLLSKRLPQDISGRVHLVYSSGSSSSFVPLFDLVLVPSLLTGASSVAIDNKV